MNEFTTDISHYRPRVSQSEIAKIITDSTSGTTGAEKRVYYTAADLDKTVEVFEKGLSEVVDRKCLVCFPDTGPNSLGDLICRAVRNLGAEAVQLPPGRTYREMLAFAEGCDSFVGFPQWLLALQRIQPGIFKKALISGDYCIRADYGIPVFPHYGSREMGLAGAISCRCRSGMHMRPDVDIEIIDGELIVTTHLEAMPLIRYKTGDYTDILPEPCPCGSTWVRIGPVSRHNAIETLDDEMFNRYPDLIDWRGDRLVFKDEIDMKPLFEGKRKL